MSNVTDLLKSVRDKAYADGYKAGHEAGYKSAFDELSRAAENLSEPVKASLPNLEDLDALIDEGMKVVRPGTSQWFALAGVRANPGASGADIQRYCANEGHDKAYPQIYTALKRLADKELVENRGGKWFPKDSTEASP